MSRNQRSYGRVVATTVIVILTAALVIGALYFVALPYLQPATGISGLSSAPVSFGAKDAFTGASIASASAADIIAPSDLSKPLEAGLTTATTTFTSGDFYSPTTQLLIHVESSGYYDNFQQFAVPSTLTVVSNTQTYNLGTVSDTFRAAKASTTGTLSNPDGTVLSTTFAASSTGTYTATGKIQTFTFEVRNLDTSGTAWAFPMPYITSSFKMINLVGIEWIGFDNTAVNVQQMLSAGWALINNAPSGSLVLYKAVPQIDTPNTSSIGSHAETYTIDTSAIAGASHVFMTIWAGDLQNTADAQLGVSDGAPVGYGAVQSTGYGLSSISGKAYTSTQVLGEFTVFLLQEDITTA